MLHNAGSLLKLVLKVFELEAEGQVGRRVTDSLIAYAKQTRKDGYANARDGESAAGDGMRSFVKLVRALKACGMISEAQYDELIEMISRTFSEGSHIYRAGVNELEPFKAPRRPQVPFKEFTLPGPLRPSTPIDVLEDLGVPPRVCNFFIRQNWHTIAELPGVAALSEMKGIGLDSIAEVQRVLIDNNYAAE